MGRLAVALGAIGVLLAATPFGEAGGFFVGVVGFALALLARRGRLRSAAIWLNSAAILIGGVVIALAFV